MSGSITKNTVPLKKPITDEDLKMAYEEARWKLAPDYEHLQKLCNHYRERLNAIIFAFGTDDPEKIKRHMWR